MNQPVTPFNPQDTPARYSQFTDTVFGPISKLKLPSYIFNKSQLTLDNASLNVLIALYRIQKQQTYHRYYIPTGIATVTADGKSLMKFTGMSKNVITDGINGLQQARYINPVTQSFTTNQFQLMNPSNGNLLEESKTLLRGKENGMWYFTIPEFLMKNDIEFAKLTCPETRLYLALAWLANQRDHKSPKINMPAIELMNITGLTERSFKQALEGLEQRWLVLRNRSTPLTMRGAIQFILRNPITGDLFGETYKDNSSNPDNYYGIDSNRKANFKMSEDDTRDLFLKALTSRGEDAHLQRNGEYNFTCPFHADSTPSCYFNLTRQCFYCHGCKTTGYMVKLFTALGISMEQIGKASGGSIEYIDPDSEAEAIYIYPNKEVLRYPNKGFRQRQRETDGQYVWNVKGVTPKLYSGSNHDPMHYEDHLQRAQTVIMVEGEKDADTVTNLQLMDGKATNRVIGVTSGSASSWEPVLAKSLLGKRVIILPDDDAAGTAYANEIEQSLKDEGITDYRRVSFSGTGCKDVTDYMQSHNETDLIRLIGIDWLRKQTGYDVDDLNLTVVDSEDTLIQI